MTGISIAADGTPNETGFADHLRTTAYDDFAQLMAAMVPNGSAEVLRAYAVEDAAGHKGSVVYFMERGSDRAIKIGFAKNLNHRRLMLENEHGCAVKVLATRLGARCLESLYHNLFDVHRLHGEWFTRHPDILAEIDRLNQIGPETARQRCPALTTRRELA